MYSLIKRDPNKAYIDTWLWLPKNKINSEIVKRGLTVPSTTDDEPLILWRESTYHIGVPRGRLDPKDLDYEVIDLRPKQYKKVTFDSNNIVMDKKRPELNEQQDAFNDLVNSNGGILNMACGKGKTVICLNAIATWGEHTLVICNTNTLMGQWKSAITDPELFNLDKDKVGWIQGNPTKWDWKKPIVIASLKSLANYYDQLPEGMSLHFGRIIWDEVHHLSAKLFNKTASLFFGCRYGATATVERQDGMEFAYLWHIGKEIHVNLKQDIIPTILFKRSMTKIDLNNPNVVNKSGQVHYRKLAAYIGTLEDELDLALDLVKKGLEKGRDIIAISSSKDHVQKLHELTPNSGVLHADVKNIDDRLKMLSEHKITYGTVDMLAEALDKTSLDSLIILTEFKSPKNAQQSTGRIQRFIQNQKKEAKVIVIYHVNIPPLRRIGVKLLQYFKKCGFKVRIK